MPEKWNPGEYRKRVRVSTGKVGSRGVPEKGLGEYREGWNSSEMLENPKQAKRIKQT